MTPETWTAVIAGITFLVFWTATVLGAAVWITKLVNGVRDTLLADLNKKHDDNFTRYSALSTLVTRHETILNPDYNHNGHRGHRG